MSAKESKEIYQDMLKQFPPNELKSFERFQELLGEKNYNLYLATSGQVPVGYAIVATDKDIVWLDYLAIFEQFHSHGYGKQILQIFPETFKGVQGCFLEVEQIDEKKPNTIRRVKFYEGLGATKLSREYFYPTRDGDLAMDLYFLAFEDEFEANTAFTKAAIKNVFELLHGELAHVSEVLTKNLAD